MMQILQKALDWFKSLFWKVFLAIIVINYKIIVININKTIVFKVIIVLITMR